LLERGGFGKELRTRAGKVKKIESLYTRGALAKARLAGCLRFGRAVSDEGIVP
jgi:hypothetical protein